MRILYFDDLGLSEGNELFILRLKRKTSVEVELVRTVREFETRIGADAWLALVLDIMAQPPSDFLILGSNPPAPVKAAQTGLELLRRCRGGLYGASVKNLSIYIRSARGEEHIKRKAQALGATGYFDAAGHDTELIGTIGTLVKGAGKG